MIKKRATPSGCTKKAAQPGGVRVTVEQDNDQDADEEEVEDIDSASATATSSSEAEEGSSGSKAKGKPQQQQKKKKKQSDASGAAGLANVLRGLQASKPATVAVASDATATVVSCPILAKALTDRQRFKASGDSSSGGDGGGGGGADKNAADTADAAADISVQRRRRLVALRRRWLRTGRVKPTAGGREVERELERTACRGVVQLFNAVRAQQRTLDARLAGKSEAGRQRVLGSLSKAEFLDMLAGRKQKARSKGVAGRQDAEGDEEEEEAAAANGSRSQRKKKSSSWGVLSEDYLMKPTLTMKDWDRDSSSAEEEQQQAEGDGQQAMEED